jgi:hypothetical protein
MPLSIRARAPISITSAFVAERFLFKIFEGSMLFKEL